MKWSPYYRRYLGFAAVVAGGGLMVEHYINYGYTLHLTPVDHGLVGLVLVIAGGLAAAGRPGQNARKEED